MIFGIRAHDIDGDFKVLCQKAHESHITKLQLAPAKTFNNIDFDKFGYNTNFSMQVKDMLDSYNLKAEVLGCYINPVDENIESRKNQIERFKNFIRYASDFRSCVIGTETGININSFNTHTEDVFKILLKELEDIIQCAEKYDVTVGIEPVCVHTIHSVEMMKRLIDEVNSDKLGVIFDPVNLINIDNYMNANSIVDSAFELFGNRIKIIHIKDFTVSSGMIKGEYAGNGMLDIKHIHENMIKYNVNPTIILDEHPLLEMIKASERLKYFAQ